ncbi:MAG: hypothetical protein ACK55I_45665, partial [bacterium]
MIVPGYGLGPHDQLRGGQRLARLLQHLTHGLEARPECIHRLARLLQLGRIEVRARIHYRRLPVQDQR